MRRQAPASPVVAETGARGNGQSICAVWPQACVHKGCRRAKNGVCEKQGMEGKGGG